MSIGDSGQRGTHKRTRMTQIIQMITDREERRVKKETTHFRPFPFEKGKVGIIFKIKKIEGENYVTNWKHNFTAHYVQLCLWTKSS